LSATPERWFDEIGTRALYDYFGQPISKLSLADAIHQGALTKYRYFVHTVELEDEEAELYFDITRRIGVLAASGSQQITDDSVGASQALKILLLKRARLIASARQKIPALKRVVGPLKATMHNLFYCGDGTVETTDGETQRQLEAVTKLLGIDLGMAVDSYTSETTLEKRAELRTRFGAGELNGLVAIRCLDEGVDIPATRRAFILASSSNPRQFIQRRGRVLRKSPGKDEAEVHDFIVIPQSQSWEPAIFNVERNLFRRELARIVEFARLAENGHEVMMQLLPLRKKYNVLDL
jgi:superfamily II DNA or RNA helicase